MRSRCENSKHPAWKNYGGRGISVCKRWQSFENFYADMGDKPKAMELDRIDNNGNYEPWNCRWITRSDNIKNIRPECRFKFPIYRGESNANAKLSDEQCGAMRKDYALGGISQKKIAEAYGIGQSHVSRIIREESRRSS